MGTIGRKRLWILGIVALMGFCGFATAAAQDADPTVGDIVVDSFDCDTGVVTFHVQVADLSSTPADVNDALGYSITANYEQGSSGFFTSGYDPAAEESPYTGDVHLSQTVPLEGAEAMEEASGPLKSIVISVVVGTSDGTGPTDTSAMSYQIECGANQDDTLPPTSDGDSDNAAADDDGAGSGETIRLPATGTGTADAGSNGAVIATLAGCMTALLGVASLRLRRLV